jgi:hypothetical protein
MLAYLLNPGSTAYIGGMVGVNSSGLLVPMTAAAGLKCVGCAWYQFGQLLPDTGGFTNVALYALGTHGLDDAVLWGTGAGSLHGLTTNVTVNGNAISTITWAGGSTSASKAAFLAALNTAINTACSTSGVVYATQGGGGGLLISASTSVLVVAGTGNTLLGLPVGAGNVLVQVRRGLQFMHNSATAPALVADIHQPIYAEDDNTVCTTIAAHSPAGILYSIVDGTLPGDENYGPGCWVDVGAPCISYGAITAPTGVILTAPTSTGQVLTATSTTAAHYA